MTGPLRLPGSVADVDASPEGPGTGAFFDLDGTLIGRIQTFVPPGRALPPGTFDVGIGLREHARGQGYGREALDLFTGWLFRHAAAEVVEGSTDPANAAMRAVFQRAGWTFAGPVTEVGREWDQYRITRHDWAGAGRLG